MLAIMLAQINEVKNNLSYYLDVACKGEEVILSRYNLPIAKIVALEKPAKKNRTVLGCSAHEGKILSDLDGPFIPQNDWNMLNDNFEL